MSEVPAGYAALRRSGPFLEILGPLYMPEDVARANVVALKVLRKHLNLRGIVHGGVLTALADTAFGIVLSRSREPRLSTVTVNLTTDFLEAVREGDFVEAHVDILRVGTRLAYVSGLLKVGERPVLRASGVFAILVPR